MLLTASYSHHLKQYSLRAPPAALRWQATSKPTLMSASMGGYFSVHHVSSSYWEANSTKLKNVVFDIMKRQFRTAQLC